MSQSCQFDMALFYIRDSIILLNVIIVIRREKWRDKKKYTYAFAQLEISALILQNVESRERLVKSATSKCDAQDRH